MNVKVNALSYRYNKQTPYQVQALDRVSFQVNSGEVIGLIGLSGSGKSSLLYCIAGGLKPDNGTIEVTGFGKIPFKTGLVIQEPERQFFANTVREEVTYALSQRGTTPAQNQVLAEQVLQKVGFRGDLNHSPFRLSGGEQRRVAMASILVMEPQLLLLDEPTVGMDRSGLAMLRELIKDYRASERAMLLASHDLDFLYAQADRFIVLKSGKLLVDFPKAEFDKNVALLQKHQINIPELIALQQRPLPDYLREFL